MHRALGAWLVMMVLAIANGGVRDALLVPRLGAHVSHVVSCFTLAALIVLTTWLLYPRLRIRTRSDAFRVGGLWLSLTVAFEFLAGHFLFATAWSALLADYDVTAGRLWIVVLIATLMAPFVVGIARGELRRPR